MSQVQNIYQYEDYKSISNDNDSYNRFESCEEVVDAIISKGLLNSCDKTSALNKNCINYMPNAYIFIPYKLKQIMPWIKTTVWTACHPLEVTIV